MPVFGTDSIEMTMRLRIRDTIDELVKEEFDAALGALSRRAWARHARGIRHGTRERTLTTSLGPTTIAMPRVRMRANGRGIRLYRPLSRDRKAPRRYSAAAGALGVPATEADPARLQALARNSYPGEQDQIPWLARIILELHTAVSRHLPAGAEASLMDSDAGVRLWRLSVLSLRRSPLQAAA
jgi:hypothetical protein